MATLIAIYLLTEAFSEISAEWALLVKKAKDYLKQQGVDKPDAYLNKINFVLNWNINQINDLCFISCFNTFYYLLDNFLPLLWCSWLIGVFLH